MALTSPGYLRLPKTRITLSQGSSNGSRASPNMKNLIFQCGETYISPIIIPITANIIYIYTRKYTPLEYLQLFHAFSPIPPPFTILPSTWMKAQDLQCFFVDLPCALRRVSLCTLLPVEAAAGQPYSAAGTGDLRPGHPSGGPIPNGRPTTKRPKKENGQCFQVVDDIYVICPEFQFFSLCCLHDIYFIFADCQDKS